MARTISNSDLWTRYEQVKVETDTQKQKFGWIGHKIRKSQDEVCMKHYNETHRDTDNEAGQKKTLTEARRNCNNLINIARDQRKWKEFTES